MGGQGWVDLVEISCGLEAYSGCSWTRIAGRMGMDGRLRGGAGLVLEVVDRVRAVVPGGMPLFVRVSTSDGLEDEFHERPSWTMEDTIKLAGTLPDHRVDLIEVSAIGGTLGQPNLNVEEFSLSDALAFSAAVKETVGIKLVVRSVDGYTDGKAVEETLGHIEWRQDWIVKISVVEMNSIVHVDSCTNQAMWRTCVRVLVQDPRVNKLNNLSHSSLLVSAFSILHVP
ncbi:hypothetical protein JAAARDRAFT_661014 [Jaapia argillacea MUCL 33604]|uniref:NADH:flavin oxidoreductase/NADH oxidase N-terminal domain-containing protein n=1 Tax=Jaapia argillacea MUCL 33604 TaxID=933084 RepID=A0A067PE71_9AGAM|nr:hypothetical protein JAAARDRAFT_661014 [Jaapia argillacea MUCL 33604]